MTVSIIVVSHVHVQQGKKRLKSITKYCDFNKEVILIDNINDGISYEKISEQYGMKNIKVVRNIRPLSFAINNNVGASLASNPSLVFLNPDIELINYSLSSWLSKTKLGEQLYFPKLLNPDLTPQCHGKVKPSFFDQILTFFSSLMRFKRESKAGDYWYFGAAIICEKSFFYKLSGFDTDFPMYAEDTELCDRVRKLGFKLSLVEDIELIHGLGGDSKGKYLGKAVISNIILRYKMFMNYISK